MAKILVPSLYNPGCSVLVLALNFLIEGNIILHFKFIINVAVHQSLLVGNLTSFTLARGDLGGPSAC
jgi:hypothetical protein